MWRFIRKTMLVISYLGLSATILLAGLSVWRRDKFEISFPSGKERWDLEFENWIGAFYFADIYLPEPADHYFAHSSRDSEYRDWKLMDGASWNAPGLSVLVTNIFGKNSVDLYVSIFYPLALFGIAPSITFARRRFKRRIRHKRELQGLCLNCGYDIRATPQVCPECGTPNPISYRDQPTSSPTHIAAEKSPQA